MKTLISILTTLTLLSCNPPAADHEAQVELSITDTLVFESVPYEHGGNWVNKKYVDKLLLTKSPKASQEAVLLTMVTLPRETEQEAMLIWSFHEGGNYILRRINNQFGLAGRDSRDLRYELSVENDILTLDSNQFIQIHDHEERHDYDIAEQLLFAGNYDLSGKEVEFTADGQIIGLDTITYYSVLIDYWDAGLQVDQIVLGANSDDSKLYGFKFSHDTLSIYQLNCLEKQETYCAVVENGLEVLKMIKKRKD